MKEILEDPDDYVMSIERYSVSNTSIVGWGRRIDRKNDYVAQQALKLMEGVNSVVPGVFIMETIPFLVKLPSWIYKLPSQISFGGAVMWRYFYLLTEEGSKASEDNFSKILMNSQEKQGLTDVEVGGLAGNLIGGGVDTTSSTMISCVLAMCAFPEVQRKAQAEIDSVVGPDRSPTWEDVDGKLPYMVALVKEVLRWRSVAVLAGIPHANTRDVEYKGYHFPAGTNMIGNLWAIHRNPRDFPNPDEFRPERFLNGLQKPYPNAKGSNPFGWGRRQCSGQPFAEQGLLYSLTRLIWAFDLKPGLDDNVCYFATPLPSDFVASLQLSQSNEVKLDIFAYTESENMRPEPFKARFTPRNEKIHRLVMEEASVAREALRKYDGETRLTMEDAARNPAWV
jgi:cytochrome P450